MKLVIIESPYAGDVERNLYYGRLAMKDSFDRGEAPFASHLLYTRPHILDDNLPDDRTLGINAGLAWGSKADLTAVYADLGFSKGMLYGIENAKNSNRPIEIRYLFSKKEIGLP